MADDSPAYQGIHSPFVPTGAQVRDRPDANDIEVGMTGKQVTQALYGEVSEMPAAIDSVAVAFLERHVADAPRVKRTLDNR